MTALVRWQVNLALKECFNDMDTKETGRFIALVLRHKPEAAGISLDKHGWANVNELLDGINKNGRSMTFDDLKAIVKNDNKQRFSLNGDYSLIRANQGHSVAVDVELRKAAPPDMLWHGTGEKYVASIDESGLIPKSRLYVHLSCDIDTAEKVGARHGKPVVYKVHSGRMYDDGYKFYLSVNNVWLTEKVPVEYLEKN